MNDENKEMDTEIPIKVSEKERAIVLEALEQVKRGEVKTQEEVEKHVQQLLDDLENASYESVHTKSKEFQQAGIASEI